ncbi:MAG TPA: hypothetical protein VNT55_18010 [Baekduia sp.]|nr:hypothetical protein [Baekduia sp.]
MPRFRTAVVVVALAAIVPPGSAVAASSSAPRLAAVSGAPAAITPGGGLAVKYTIKGGRKPASAKLTARLEPAAASKKGAAIALRGTATVKVQRRQTVRGTLRLGLAHGRARAGRYVLKACLRAGKTSACRTVRTLTVRPEPSGVQAPGPSAAPATQSPATTTTPPPAPAAPAVLDLDAPANPVTVDPTLDTARAVTASIDTMGGTVEATGAHGERYRLDIPYGALLARTDITVTPLKSVGDLPFSGGLVAGAALAPDGLRFSEPVRLTITGAPAVAPDRETGFGYRGDGRDLGLVPMVRDAHQQAFDLMHFSAYGIAAGTDAERRAQLVRHTTDVEGRLQQVVATELQLDRAYQLTGAGRPADQATLDRAIVEYHDKVIQPLMAAAMDDVRLTPRALVKYLAWERQLSLLWGEDFLKDVRAARAKDFIKILHHAADYYYNKCLAGDPGALPVLLAWSRQLALLGADDDANQNSAVFEACARFEVDLETTIDQSEQGEDQTFHGHLTLDQVPFTLQGGFQVAADGLWHQDAFTITPKGAPDVGCWLDTSGFEPTGQAVGSIQLQVNWIEDVDGDEYQLQEADIADVGLNLAPFLTREDVHWGFCGSSTGQGGPRSWLGVTLAELHADEQPPGTFGWTVKNWTRAGNAAFVLTKDYQRTTLVDNFYPTTETTHITLRHTPASVD